MNQINQRSRRLRILFQWLFWLIPLYAVAYWVLSYWYKPHGIAALAAATISHNPMIQLPAFLLSLIPFAIMMYIFRQLIHLFRHYEQGTIFHIMNVRLYHKMGKGLMLFAVVNWIIHIAINAILSMQTAHFVMNYGFANFTHNLMILFIGVITSLISWVMYEAYRLSDDNVKII